MATLATLVAGDLIYVYSDGNKIRARDGHVVMAIEKGWCDILVTNYVPPYIYKS